ILLAIFLTIILDPLLTWLVRHRWPKAVAVTIVMLVTLMTGIVLLGLFGTAAVSFGDKLPQYQTAIDDFVAQFREPLSRLGIDTSRGIFAEMLDANAAVNLLTLFFNSVNQLLKYSFLVLVTTFFLLLEWSALARKLAEIDSSRYDLEGRWATIIENVRRYIAIKTKISLATGFLIGLTLKFLQVDYAEVWGVVAFLLNYVPNIGALIAAIPATLLALVQAGPTTAIWTVLTFLVINQILGTVIEPRLQGRGLGLSPLVVFLSLIFWGWVFGAVGVLLSAPLTMIVRIVFESSERTRWISVMLGPPPKLDRGTTRVGVLSDPDA
ncbi:MAG: AI-2E family transporter, partial [Phycisphaerae bacterium]